MAVFSFSGALPPEKGEITSSQLRDRFNDVNNYNTAVNPEGVSLPATSGGSQFQSLVLNAALNGFDLSHVIRADGAVTLSNVASLTSQDLIYFDGTNLNRLAKGADGTSLQVNSGNLSWQSVASVATPSLLTSSTTPLSPIPENSINIIDPSAGSITHWLPATAIVSIKAIKLIPDGVNSWETTNWTLNGNGNNIIVVNADGSVEAAAATIDITANVPMTVYCNGTEYIVMGGA